MPSSSRSLRKTFSLYRPWFAQINKGTMRADLIAGFTNAAIVLPQGVAFAIIAGLPPEYGLFTAMIPPIIAALFGSSMVMISGPTTAISAVLFASLSAQAVPGTAHYVEMALLLTILVGLIQLAAGLLRLGALITFISHSVIVGFTAAAALLIGASQLAPALGFTVERGGGVFERLIRVANSLDQTSLLACSLALFTLATLILCAKISRSLPNYLIALAGGS
jgi:SulP family sulfate permease